MLYLCSTQSGDEWYRVLPLSSLRDAGAVETGEPSPFMMTCLVRRVLLGGRPPQQPHPSLLETRVYNCL